MNDNKILSGTAMAVLVSFGSIIASVFTPNLTLGDRIILFLMGCIFAGLGILFSRG